MANNQISTHNGIIFYLPQHTAHIIRLFLKDYYRKYLSFENMFLSILAGKVEPSEKVTKDVSRFLDVIFKTDTRSKGNYTVVGVNITVSEEEIYLINGYLNQYYQQNHCLAGCFDKLFREEFNSNQEQKCQK
jgi:hypothetical protein